MHHTSVTDIHVLKWQFLKSQNLTPLSYSNQHRLNPTTGVLEKANIWTDLFTGFPSITIRELFWVGFGDLCSIPDQFVRPINNLWKGLKDPVPTAAKRFPKWITSKYFPVFNSGNYTGLSHTLEEVGECNTRCLPIPRPTFMRETEQGRLQYEAYRFDGNFDFTLPINLAEFKLSELWANLRLSGYCSPYVTQY